VFILFHVLTALVGLGFLIIEILRSHSDTLRSVGLLWKGDRHRRRDLYLTTCSKQKGLTSMTLAGFELWVYAEKFFLPIRLLRNKSRATRWFKYDRD